MRTPRGFTLVETLVTIALAGTALTIVAVALSGLQRASRRVLEETSLEMEWQRLALQLRSDAHEAVSAETEAAAEENTPAGTLVLTRSGDTTVCYTLQDRYIERNLRRGDEVLHRETYRIPEAFTARWELEEKNSARMVSLILAPGPEDLGSLMGDQPLQIKAAVGLLRSQPAQAKS